MLLSPAYTKTIEVECLQCPPLCFVEVRQHRSSIWLLSALDLCHRGGVRLEAHGHVGQLPAVLVVDVAAI
jgi:hypothetical protein